MIPIRQLFVLALFAAATLTIAAMTTCAFTLQSPNCINATVVFQHYWREWKAEQARRERS